MTLLRAQMFQDLKALFAPDDVGLVEALIDEQPEKEYIRSSPSPREVETTRMETKFDARTRQFSRSPSPTHTETELPTNASSPEFTSGENKPRALTEDTLASSNSSEGMCSPSSIPTLDHRSPFEGTRCTSARRAVADSRACHTASVSRSLGAEQAEINATDELPSTDDNFEIEPFRRRGLRCTRSTNLSPMDTSLVAPEQPAEGHSHNLRIRAQSTAGRQGPFCQNTSTGISGGIAASPNLEAFDCHDGTRIAL